MCVPSRSRRSARRWLEDLLSDMELTNLGHISGWSDDSSTYSRQTVSERAGRAGHEEKLAKLFSPDAPDKEGFKELLKTRAELETEYGAFDYFD